MRCVIARLPVAPGRYVVGARVMVGSDEADWPRDGVGEMVVEAGDYFGTGSHGFPGKAPLMLTGKWDLDGCKQPDHRRALTA